MQQFILTIMASLALAISFTTSAVEMDHSKMNHANMNHNTMNTAQTPLPTEAGNDAFGTIQEIMALLINDPTTDWSKVNFEALRQHLLDMDDMTKNVDVLSQTPIDGGMIAIIKPTTDRSAVALKRVLMAHPMVLKSESGFDMRVKFNNGQYVLTTTTTNKADVDKIRGLGYIGLMAYGNHHQAHHLSMAKGANPHAAHGSN